MRKIQLSWAVVLALSLVPIRMVCQSAPGMAAAKASISSADEKNLVTMEREAWEIIKKKDWKGFDRLLTTDFVWIDDGGTIAGREAAVKYFMGLDLSNFTMEDVKVTAFAPNVAFVTYRITEDGHFQGEPLPAKPYYIGSGYVKRGGKWGNFFVQTTLSR